MEDGAVETVKSHVFFFSGGRQDRSGKKRRDYYGTVVCQFLH